MKKEVYLTHDGILIIDGKEYISSIIKQKDIGGIKHIDKQLFKEFNRERFEKKVDFIVGRIEHALDKSEIIKELIKKTPLNEMNTLYKLLKEDEKLQKEIKKQKGCLGLKIGTGQPKTGGMYIDLIS